MGVTGEDGGGRIRLADFVPDSSGVRVRPGSGDHGISYADGGEAYLAEALGRASDRSVMSEELAASIRDWPSQYHLTRYRATIMDAVLPDPSGLRVLELGAGCGAVTRWLGERGARVDAVEGSIDRARLARARAQGMPSVEVYWSDFRALDLHGEHDVVTLIGVLEYAPAYAGAATRREREEACVDILRLAAAGMRPGGALVVAIENRMGMKYWLGAPEDHTGIPFDGLQGYPRPATAVTFSAPELRALLARAGFGGRHEAVAFPDYKIARTLLASDWAASDPWSYNWVDAPFSGLGGQGQAGIRLNEAQLAREVGRAGLLADLANSFVWVAWRDGEAPGVDGFDLGWCARHYSLDRRPREAKRATLRRGGGVEVVQGEPWEPGAPPLDGATPLVHRFTDAAAVPGELLVYRAFDLLAADDGEGFSDLLSTLAEWLPAAYWTGALDADEVPLLTGDALDVTLWNLIASPDDDEWTAIDPEWRLEGPIPLTLVLWRGLRHLRDRWGPWLGREPLADGDAFGAHWTAVVVPGLRPGSLADFADVERWVQSRARFGPDVAGPPPPVLAAWADGSPSRRPYEVACLGADLAGDPGWGAALLEEFASGFWGVPECRLLVLQEDWSPAGVDAVASAVRRAGLDADDAPEVLLQPLPSAGPARPALARRVGALALAGPDPPPGLGPADRTGPGGLAALVAAARLGAAAAG